MTWTREHDRLIAERICGYEVDVSPRGAYFIREKGNPWRALPNFQVDAFETASTLDAACGVPPFPALTVSRERGKLGRYAVRIGDTAALDRSLIRASALALYRVAKERG